MKYRSPEGKNKLLPSTPIFLLATATTGGIIVPCFNYSEAAMVEFFLNDSATATDIQCLAASGLERRLIRGRLSPETVRAAAEYVRKNNKKQVYSKISGKSKAFIIGSTSRRILVDARSKPTSEIIREQIRKGV